MISHLRTYAIVGALLLLGVGPIFGQWNGRSGLDSAWHPIEGMSGGWCLTFLSNGSRLFAGTEAGVYRSTDNGMSWTNGGGGPTMNSAISSLAGCPGFMLAAGRAVYKSTDAGTSWHPLDEQFGGGVVNGVGVHHTIAFVAVQGQGIFRSTDGANSWSPANDGIGQVTPSIVKIASDGQAVYALARQGRLYRSLDGGLQWQTVAVANAPVQPSAGLHIGTSAVFYDAGPIYDTDFVPPVSRAGLYRSVDHGATWLRADSGLPDVRTDAVVETAGGFLCAADGGLFTSVDGNAWTRLDATLPFDWSSREPGVATPALYVHNGVVLAGTRYGAYRSTDDGLSWESADSGLISSCAFEMISNRGMLLAATPHGVYSPVDVGAPWQRLDRSGLAGSTPWAFVRDTTKLLVVAGAVNDSVYGTIDGGIDWIPIGPAPSRIIVAIGSHLVAGGESGMWISDDSGRTWRGSNSGLPSDVDHPGTLVPIITVAAHAGMPYVGTANGGVYRSIDGGETWTAVNTGIAHRAGGVAYVPINELVSDAGVLYALSDGGIFRLSTGGTAWKEVKTIDSRSLSSVAALAVDADNGRIFIATGYGGVDVSADSGRTWRALDSGFWMGGGYDPPRVSRLTIHGGSVYAITNAGVWAHAQSAISAVPGKGFRGTTTVSAGGGHILLHVSEIADRNLSFTLYDMLGRTMLERQWDAGSTGGDIIVETPALIPGFYLYAITSRGDVVTGTLTYQR